MYTVLGTLYSSFTAADGSDEVLVEFQAGDPRSPFVVGALWNSGQPPEMDSSSTSATITVVDDESSTHFTTSMPTFTYVGQDFTAIAQVSDPTGGLQPARSGKVCMSVKIITRSWPR